MNDTAPAARLRAVIGRFAQARVWVAGDVMLDEYVLGEVERISPEAPVPVVRVSESFFRLGGAANVARSISALGARVRLCGLVGTDTAGDEILRLCEQTGIDATAVARIDRRQTTRKTRILGLGHQLLRLDRERLDPCPEALTERLIGELERGPSPTAVLLSDYGKGMITATAIRGLIAVARRHRVPVLVDPHGADFAAYRGATLLKPNLRELEAATGRRLRGAPDEMLIEVGRELVDAAGVEAVVLTLSERGMLVIPRHGAAELIPAQPQQVYDVTGAGDTVIAVLGLALSVGADLGDAARIANRAAGLVVRKVGAVSVETDQLTAELGSDEGFRAHSWVALGEQVATWKLQGRSVVFTNGCFDLLHAGHVALLKQASEQGDALVVGLNSDSSVARLKGPGRPLVAESGRIALLKALKFVDAVAVFEEDTPLELIRLLRPDVLVKGADYRLEEVVGRELVESYGGKVVLISLLPDYSTSTLIDRIRNPAPAAARE